MSLTDKQKVKIIEEEKYRASLISNGPSSYKPKKGGLGCGTIVLFVTLLLIASSVAILVWQKPSELAKKSEQRENVGKYAYNKTNGVYRGKITAVKPCTTAPKITCYVVENPEYSRPMEAPVENTDVREK